MLKQQMVRQLRMLAQNQPLQISPLINNPKLKPLLHQREPDSIEELRLLRPPLNTPKDIGFYAVLKTRS